MQGRATNARHDGAQLLLGFRTFFRRPKIEMLIGIAHAKQKLVDQLPKRGVAATFRIWFGGGFAHAMRECGHAPADPIRAAALVRGLIAI